MPQLHEISLTLHSAENSNEKTLLALMHLIHRLHLLGKRLNCPKRGLKHIYLTTMLCPEKATSILAEYFSDTDNLCQKELQVSVRLQGHGLCLRVSCKFS